MTTLYKYVAQGGKAVTFLDETDVYDAETIRKHWANTFPELGSAQTSIDDKTKKATHEGQEIAVDKIVTFAKKVGTKGQHPAIAALLEVGPANTEGLGLAIKLQREPVTVGELVQLGPEIQTALTNVRDLSNKSREVVNLCKGVPAVPSSRLPVGF